MMQKRKMEKKIKKERLDKLSSPQNLERFLPEIDDMIIRLNISSSKIKNLTDFYELYDQQIIS